MRTTVELEADTTQAVRQLRREQGLGVSEAVNELIRRGLVRKSDERRFEPRTRRMGLKIDVSNVAGAIDVLEGPNAR